MCAVKKSYNSRCFPEPPPGKIGWPWTIVNSPWPKMNSIDTNVLPLVSIVTPSYNQGRFLEKTIRSVLLQDYPKIEYIIIDGGSKDNSIDIIYKYEPWLSYWISESDRGQSHAINKGFERANGEILAWLNSDDIYLPGTLKYIAQEFMIRSNDVGALVGIGHKVDKNGAIVYTPTTSELSYTAFLNWLGGNNFMQPSCFFRSIAWEGCGPLREDLYYSMDLDLWLNMIREYNFEKIDRVLSHALRHIDAKTTADKERMRAEIIWLVMQHGGMDSAYHHIMKMADMLSSSNKKLEILRRTFIYKICTLLIRFFNIKQK